MWLALRLLALALGRVPRPGTEFAGVLQVPVVGKQYVNLTVLCDSRASVALSGLVEARGLVTYRLDHRTRTVRFTMDPDLDAVMRKYRCTLDRATFTEHEAAVEVRIRPLRVTRQIVLQET